MHKHKLTSDTLRKFFVIIIFMYFLLGLSNSTHSIEVKGLSSGVFLNPYPPSAVVGGVGTNYFTWGDPANFGTGPSSLKFTGRSFATEIGNVFSLGTLRFFNGTIAGGSGADYVDLQINIMITTPSGEVFSFIRTLRLINTLNTSDPIASADIVYLPTSFPENSFRIGGYDYTVSIIGFGNFTGPGFTTLDRFHVFENSSASAELLARVGRACIPANNGQPIEEIIYDIESCPPTGRKNPTWGQFGKKPDGILIANSGEKLEIECSGIISPSFKMWYTSPDGVRFRVGKCPFEGGCNFAWFWHSGDEDKDGNPDCFMKTRWISRDYGLHNDNFPNPWTGNFEPFDNKLDWAETVFDVNSTKLSKTDYKYEYVANHPLSCPNNPPPEGRLVETISVDPLIGPETEEFFDEVQERLDQMPAGAPMSFAFPINCDLNGDENCDIDDHNIFTNALGKCRGEAGYLPLADGDADGCVTAQDEKYVFTIPVKIDIKPGSFPNSVNINSKGVLPVAILSSNSFDASMVDPTTVRLGPKGAVESHGKGHLEDVNGDGYLDMVLHFKIQEIGIMCGETSITLKGKTFDGNSIMGIDEIKTVNCK